MIFLSLLFVGLVGFALGMMVPKPTVRTRAKKKNLGTNKKNLGTKKKNLGTKKKNLGTEKLSKKQRELLDVANNLNMQTVKFGAF